MADYSICPIEWGKTLKGTDSAGTLINTEWEGRLYEMDATDYSTAQLRGNKTLLTGRQVTVRVVRNTSGAVQLGKRIVRAELDGYETVGRSSGYARTTLEGNILGASDPYLDSNGVAADDLYLVVVEGPTTVLTPDTGTGMIDIAVGDSLIAATAAASTNATAGRIRGLTLAGQTAATDAFNAAMNCIGRALSARTTAETAEDLLIWALCRR